MSSKSDWPQFEPEDADGFRSFSLYTGNGKLTYRISVHFGALREGLKQTAGNFKTYSKGEQESMKAAAALLAAKVPGKLNPNEMIPAQVAELSLTNLLQGIAELTPRTFEIFFPGLTKFALQVASDACVKRALNNAAQGFKVPLVTTEESVDILLNSLNKAIKLFLRQSGRRRGTPKLLQDMQIALQKLNVKAGKRPTQQRVSEIMGIDPRTLRKSMAKYGVKTWDEMLLACKYWEELNTTLN